MALHVLLGLLSLMAGATASLDFEDILPSDVPVTMMERITDDTAAVRGEYIEHMTPMGVAKGQREPSLGVQPLNSHFYSFRGIPFAEPPVGDLRWAEPVDKRGAWPGGYLDATRFRSFCPQYDTESKRVLGKEDCLYLNVYTPYLPGSETANNRTGLLPVFVFFHGGAFLRGSSSAHGPARLLAHDVVLVTLNYRLGALGFLTTEDTELPGNYGMLDQVSALRWVRDHISHFGGDSSRVTLGGFSAGAGSVHIHMVSPLSRGLFHGGVMMSGAGNCQWAVRKNLTPFAHQLAKGVGCPTASSAQMKACLSGIPTEDLLTAQAAMHHFGFWPLPFVMTVDGGLRDQPFLPEPVSSLPIARVPVLIGGVPDEGLLFAAGVILMSDDPSSAASVYKQAVPYIFNAWYDEEDVPLMRSMTETFYFTEHAKKSHDILLEEMSEGLTDYVFGHCMWDAAATLAEDGLEVYTYMNTHRDMDTPTWATPLYNRLRDLGIQTPLLEKGVSHGDDMVHLFDFPYALGKFSERDQMMSTFVTTTWANFVANGSPARGDISKLSWANLDSWTPVQPHQPMSYFRISVEPTMVFGLPKQKEMNFWQHLIPRTTQAQPETVSKSAHSRRDQVSCPAAPRPLVD
ncbi:esterase E4-like [Penaeus japonicus]|uniref:esterase E4-like n=1 Tax=Penaeus japonicus TaxID=27405 RepID=UPI001C712482|nr:esterase E4-like [Penaeus japonicus]XP_042868543.1 esterase E4-like [Penaeus japonicus]